MAARADLLDVNLWLALSVPGHPHHDRAHRYWKEESAIELAFCRSTALALLRLTTQPAVMGDDPLSVPEAWNLYRSYRALPEVVLRPEPEGLESRLDAWARTKDATPRLWTDAYLAAFAITGALRMVTFDRDFDRFEDLDLLRLTDD